MNPIATIYLSETARSRLITLKRRTKIPNWNTLCRRAFCRSLAEPTPPVPTKIPSDSGVEMTWKTFGGKYEGLYFALLKQRCTRDGLALDDTVLVEQFRLHLHRGIEYLYGNRNTSSIQTYSQSFLARSRT